MATLVDKHGNIDYFGHLSWANFFDWLITLCLGGIIAMMTVSLGGVRAETQLMALPLFVCLLVLHGIWLALNHESPRRLSHVPLLFVPFMVWVAVSINRISPTPWLGRYELIAFMQALIFLWVAVNNVRTRAHLWVLIIMAISPAAYSIFIGFYQFFQDPNKIATAFTSYTLRLNPEFVKQATGSFADPNVFAIFLLILLPAFSIAAAVPRFPKILRLLCLYLSIMLICALFFTQVFWPIFVLIPLIYLMAFLCYKTLFRRLLVPTISTGLLLLLSVGLFIFQPRINRSISEALSEGGERTRLVLWQEAVAMLSDAPLVGVGAGAYASEFEQSPRVGLSRLPETPHNDYLLLLSEYGIVGALLFVVPSLYVIGRCFRRWRLEPLLVRLKGRKGSVMPPEKFFLTLGLVGIFAYGLSSFFSFVFYVPALVLYGVLFISILIKSSFSRRISLPEHSLARSVYVIVGCALGLGLYSYASPLLQARALENYAAQRLDLLVEYRVHVSGDSEYLDEVILDYEEAAKLDPANADILTGLSAATCLLYFQNPREFRQIAERSAALAEKAISINENHWMAWAQLGIAEALGGNPDLAENALLRALELAPNNSNAYFYWASYQSHFPDRLDEAIRLVARALEINPNNVPARRLQQKLLIL